MARSRRHGQRGPSRTAALGNLRGRSAPLLSMDVLRDRTVSNGAQQCLMLIGSLAGGPGRPFTTRSSAIAEALGSSPRAVQTYWAELAAPGWIKYSADKQTGLVTVTVAEAAVTQPVPRKGQGDARRR
jgi:hypothetical protein